MDVGEGRQLLSNWTTELQAQRRRQAESARKISAIEKIVAGLLEMFPDLAGEFDFEPGSSSEAGGVPKGAEAVRIILQEHPNDWFYVSELVDKLRLRGWLPESDNPANAVRAALERLLTADDSDVQKRRDHSDKVVYSYRPDDAPDPGPPAGYSYDEEPF